MPRTGGLAIIAGAACGLAAMAATNGALPSYALWTLGCAMAIALVSFCDDRWTLSPLVRLMLQLAIASALVLGGGVRINGISLPVIGRLDFGALAVPVSVVSLCWMANLYNFMD